MTCRVKQYMTWGMALLAVSYPEIRVLLYVVKLPFWVHILQNDWHLSSGELFGGILDPSTRLEYSSVVEKRVGFPAKHRVTAV